MINKVNVDLEKFPAAEAFIKVLNVEDKKQIELATNAAILKQTKLFGIKKIMRLDNGLYSVNAKVWFM